MSSETRYSVGDTVYFKNGSETVQATVKEVYPKDHLISRNIYRIVWPPTGDATVGEEQLFDTTDF